MNLKISSAATPPPEIELDAPADCLYDDLIDWAKERKQQFLRNRAKGLSISPKSDNTDLPINTETDNWIQTWYTPPSIPSSIARQMAIAPHAPNQAVRGDAEGGNAKVVRREEQSRNQNLESTICTPTSSVGVIPAKSAASQKGETSLQDLYSIIPLSQGSATFEIGQPVLLRPDARRIPAGIPSDAVLLIQEICVNPYRQHQNVWCVWCKSDAFSGLKSIDSDCLMPLPEPIAIAATNPNPATEGTPIMELAGFSIDGIPGYNLSPTPISAVVSYELVEEGLRLAEVLKPLQSCPVIAIDTETTGLDPLTDRIRLVQIAAIDHPVIVIDLFKVAKADLDPLRELLQDNSIKVLQNAKFDLKFLHRAGLPLGGKLFDTMLAAQLLAAGVRSHAYNLAELVKVYLGEDLSKEQQRSDWRNPQLATEQLAYAARDAAMLLRLREVMKPKLLEARLGETAKLEFECLEAIAEMELSGMLLDLSQWDRLRQELEQHRQQLADELCQQLQPALLSTQLDMLGHEVSLNLDSQPQVLKVLQQLGVPIENTSKYSLIPLAAAYPQVKALLDYRKAAKSVQAFGSSLPKHVHPITGRIHPDYQQIGATTGRMACRNPNLQQIPRDKIFRSCFIPAPGYRLIVADYSQIELRVAAELSGDRRMIAAYQNDEDLHRLTAALIADKPLDQVDKSERQAAKAVNFGLIYAMGAKGLAEYAYNNYGVPMSLKQAEIFRQRYFEAYQGIARWHGTIKRRLPKEIRTLGHRLRRWQDEPRLTELLNTPVQGTSADITKAALAKLPAALQETGARLIGTVHDEILLEVPEDRAEQAAQILQQVMEQAGQRYLRKVPVKAEVFVVNSWAEK